MKRGTRGLRSVLNDSLVYGIGVGILPAALLVATPLIARRVGADGFGAIDLLTAILTLASAAAIMGMDTGLAQTYFGYMEDQRLERLTVVRTAFLAVFATSAGASVALGGIAAVFAVTLHQEPSDVSIGALVAAFVLLPFSTSVVMAREVFRLERRRRTYVLTTAVQAIAGVGSGVALVALGGGPAGYFAGLTIGAVAGLAYCLRAHPFFGAGAGVDRRQLRTMVGYGLPLVPAALATWVTFAIDRTLLASMRGLFDVGYYALASKIAAPLFMALSAFSVAWVPFILQQPEKRQLELRARALTAVAAAAAICYVMVLLFTPELVRFLGGSAYSSSAKAVPGIALGWVFWGIAYVIATEFVVSRRTKLIAIATGVAGVANVVLNLALIPPFGFVGAAWATTATFAILAAIYLVAERRTTRVPYHWGRVVAVLGIVAGVTAVALGSALSLSSRVAVAIVAVVAAAGVAASERGSRGWRSPRTTPNEPV